MRSVFAFFWLISAWPRLTSSARFTRVGSVTFASDTGAREFGSVRRVGLAVVDNHETASVWRLQFDGYETVDSLGAQVAEREIKRVGNECQFHWRQVGLHHKSSSALRKSADMFVNVQLSVRLDEETGLALIDLGFSGASKPICPLSWSIAVRASSTTTNYHVLENRGFGLLHSCSRSQPWGKQDKCASFSSVYPSDSASFQLIALLNDHGAMYFAAHDPEFGTKKLVSTGIDFRLEQDAELTLVKSYRMRYPLALGAVQVTSADWFDVAQVYRRAFALPTLQGRHGRKRLMQRPDLPAWFQDLAVWINSHWQIVDVFNPAGGDPSVVANLMAKVLDQLDLFGGKAGMHKGGPRVGFHWYEWDTLGYRLGSNYTECSNDKGICGFDTHYPEYFPARLGFEQTSRWLDQKGVLVMPYVNGRIFDRDVGSWTPNAQSAAAKKNGALDLYAESYGSRARFAVMCPATRYWQTIVSDTVNRLSSSGIPYVYVDQVAAARPLPCFDPSHAHSAGGGAYWAAGQFAWAQRAKDLAKKEGNRTLVLMTEGLAEPYVGLIDSFLTLGPMNAQTAGQSVLVPFFQAVYGGWSTWAGAFFFKEDLTGPSGPDAFATKLAKQLVHGVQLGWFALLGRHFHTAKDMGLFQILFQSVEYAAELAYLKKLVLARFQLKAFFVHGRTSRAPIIWQTGAPSAIEVFYNAIDGQQLVRRSENPIQAATWLNSDASKLLVIYTWAAGKPHRGENSSAAVHVTWTIEDVERGGLTKASAYDIERLDVSTGRFSPVARQIIGPRISFSCTLARRQVQAFLIVAASSFS